MGGGVVSGLVDGSSTLGRGAFSCGGIYGRSEVPTLGVGARWAGSLG